MELKQNISKPFPASVLRINRTFMELKRLSLCGDEGRSNSINRTFMELKLVKLVCLCIIMIVIIEPLWNWNIRGGHLSLYSSRVLIEPLWNYQTFIRLKSITETVFHCIPSFVSPSGKMFFRKKSVILSYRFNNMQYINKIQKLTKAYV